MAFYSKDRAEINPFLLSTDAADLPTLVFVSRVPAVSGIRTGGDVRISYELTRMEDRGDGEERRDLLPWELAQIAGRAGRFGLVERGHVRGACRRVAPRVEHEVGVGVERDSGPGTQGRDDVARPGVVRIGFSREADDHVGADAQIGDLLM